MKIAVTISLDKEVKENSMKILSKTGVPLSFYIEQKLRELIKNDREVKNGYER